MDHIWIGAQHFGRHGLAPFGTGVDQIFEAVDLLEARQLSLPLGRQRRIGRHLIGQQGVATFGRHDDRMQHRAHRRLGRIVEIGVPADTVVVRADRTSVLHPVRQHVDIRVIGQREVLQGVPFQRPESPGEALEGGWVHLLPAQHDRAGTVEFGDHRRQRRGIRRGQIDSDDLAAETEFERSGIQR
nr:hypothetical protein [Novosphingobium sp. 9]